MEKYAPLSGCQAQGLATAKSGNVREQLFPQELASCNALRIALAQANKELALAMRWASSLGSQPRRRLQAGQAVKCGEIAYYPAIKPTDFEGNEA